MFRIPKLLEEVCENEINTKYANDNNIFYCQIFTNQNEVGDRQSIFSMLRSTKLRNAMIKLIIVFMGCGCVFDGVMRLSDSFGLSFFAVFSVNEVSEFLAIVAVAVLLDR